MLKPIFLLALIGSMASANVAYSHDTTPVDQVQVIGTGEVDVEPDQVTLAVSVYAVASNQVGAKQAADDAYQSVLDEALRQGVDKTQVKVTQLRMNPEYVWESNKREYRGERVSRELSITVTDLTSLSTLLQNLVVDGVSEINSMQAGLQDASALQQQALAEAVGDARQKASFLAEQLGRTLGPVMQIVEQNAEAPMFVRQEMAMSRSMQANAPPAEMLGTQTVKAHVNLTFRLK